VKENPPLVNADVKYSLIGAESDFQIMIAKSQEEHLRRLSDENSELKNCLKELQKELFDIVDLKTDIYMKRYRAEFA